MPPNHKKVNRQGSINIAATLIDGDIHRGKLPCMVEVRITNISKTPVLINNRLAVGCRDSDSRELFVEVFRKGENEVVSEGALDYERDYPLSEHYGDLGPAESITTSFDLCNWYYFPLSLSGPFEMVIYYQADERNPIGIPEGILSGVHASDRISFKFISD